MYKARQPENCEPIDSAQVTTGYFGDLRSSSAFD
jgi:hypothetical protein